MSVWVQYRQGCRNDACNWTGHRVNTKWTDSPGNPGYVCIVWICPVCGASVTTKNWEWIPERYERWREYILSHMYWDNFGKVRPARVSGWIRSGSL